MCCPISDELIFSFSRFPSLTLIFTLLRAIGITTIDYRSIRPFRMLLRILTISSFKRFSNAYIVRGVELWVSNLTSKLPYDAVIVNVWTLIRCVCITFSSNWTYDVLILWVERIIIIAVQRAPACFSESLGVERWGLAVGWHLRDLLVIKVIIHRNVRNLIIKLMVLDEISSGALILLTVTFTEGVFLWGHIAPFTNQNHDDDKDQDYYVE